MKRSIKLSALFLLLSASVFAGTATKESNKAKATTIQHVSFSGSKNVSLNINTAGGSTVRFYDENKNLLLADRIAGKANASKAYNLGSLENGIYLVIISADRQELTKKVVVYEDNDQKGFFIVQ